MKIFGFIVNPVAGMGGSVGLKGTDSKEILTESIKRGAKPVAPKRAKEFISKIRKSGEIMFLTCSSRMGEEILKKYGDVRYEVIYECGEDTTSEDTIRAAKIMVEKSEILVFCGGDGTAKDIYSAIDAKIPLLGIPSGVKMYSSVFAVNPDAASEILSAYLEGYAEIVDGEIMDVDEEMYRKNILSVKIYGIAKTIRYRGLLQSSKSITSLESEMSCIEGIANYLKEMMEDDCLYILGTGGTVFRVMEKLGIEKTLLGVDLLYNGKIIKKDVSEKEILNAISNFKKSKIIVTVVGSQGFIFGRGNQQISAEVISRVGKNNIIVIATSSKLSITRILRVDTGDKDVDRELCGYIRVISDYHSMVVRKVISGSWEP